MTASTIVIPVLHSLLGIVCFVFFWASAWGIKAGEWFLFLIVAAASCLIGFGLSYFSSGVMPRRSGILAALFASAFILVALVCLPGLLEGNGMWRPFAFWAPVAALMFGCSYLGGFIGRRYRSRYVKSS